MRYFLAVILLLGPLSAAALFHVPHGGVHDLAIGPAPGGGQEIVAASNAPTHVMRSLDDGLSWDVVSGDGLARFTAKRVAYYPNAGAGIYLIGTNGGVWSYDPAALTVVAGNDGIPQNDRNIRDFAVPSLGSAGPAFVTTKKGGIYRLDPGTATWTNVFLFGSTTSAGTGPVSMTPHYDPLAPDGPLKTVAAAFRGVLHLSTDGGSTWAVHPQFSIPVAARDDWTILDVAFDDDYPATGILLVARGREDPLKPKRTQGEIWRSTDFGATFTLVLQIPVAVGTVFGSPADSQGSRHFYLAPFEFMGTEGAKQIGLARSDDGGLTWDDFGNEQDFSDRTGVNSGTGLGVTDRLQMAFAPSLDFGTDDTLFHARGEGLWQSHDLGSHWTPKRVREEQEVRGLAIGKDAGGVVKLYAGKYGATTVYHDLTAGTSALLRQGAPMAYARRVEVSPAFVGDGTVLQGGSSSVIAWYDPDLPASNPFGAQGWFELPLAPFLGIGGSFDGIPRSLALSPHFDSRGGPGTDMAFYWDSFEDDPMRSRDGGATLERLPNLSGGGRVPNLFDITVAPTYDDSTPGGRTDVFAGSATSLFRLEDDTWRERWDFGTTVSRVVADPDFSRPGNPRLFIVLLSSPNVVEFIDDPFSPVVNSIGQGLGDFRFRGIELAPDFTTSREIYVLTWASGIWKFNLSAPNPQWVQVGGAWPFGWRTEDFQLSPDFLTDHTFYVGTDRGIAVSQDLPGASWSLLQADSFRDDRDIGFQAFAPGDPANPDATRTWPWGQAARGQILPLTPDVTDRRIFLTTFDGSYLMASGYARVIRVHSFAGPQSGQVRVTAFEYGTANQVGQVQVDLNQPGNVVALAVDLVLPARQAVDIRIEAVLANGQALAFDGMSLLD